MLYFFDSHSHIHLNRGNQPDKLLQRARKVGVRAVLLASVKPADWATLEKFTGVDGVISVFGLGIHPHFVSEVTEAQIQDHLLDLRMRVERRKDGLVVIGETGLDFARARATPDRQRQVDAFRAHLQLARDADLPLTIHCVRAHGPLVDMLLARPTPSSVVHAFSGSAEVAAQLVGAGHFVSFAGNLCRPEARRVVETARALANGHVLIETDSPDQTPWRREGPNEPAFVVDVARRLAQIRGSSLDAVADATRTNACRLFRIDEGRLQRQFPDDILGDVERLLELED